MAEIILRDLGPNWGFLLRPSVSGLDGLGLKASDYKDILKSKA